MMQKAVHEDKVKSGLRGPVEVVRVGHDEWPIVLFARMGNVAGIDIYTKVVGMGEKMRIGTGSAAHVQHPARPGNGIVGQQRPQLGGSEGRLPRAVDEGLFQQVVENTHTERWI